MCRYFQDTSACQVTLFRSPGSRHFHGAEIWGIIKSLPARKERKHKDMRCTRSWGHCTWSLHESYNSGEKEAGGDAVSWDWWSPDSKGFECRGSDLDFILQSLGSCCDHPMFPFSNPSGPASVASFHGRHWRSWELHGVLTSVAESSAWSA